MKTLNEVIEQLQELQILGYGKHTVYLKDSEEESYYLNVKNVCVDEDGDIILHGEY